MADTISPDRRSENMRRIRSKGMKPELAVRHMVHSMGYRFRLHQKELPGSPDLVFSRLKKIIEVRGCFWHQHQGCIDSRIPKSRVEYWIPKLKRNTERDIQNFEKLTSLGWSVLVIWECEVHDVKRVRRNLQSFLTH